MKQGNYLRAEFKVPFKSKWISEGIDSECIDFARSFGSFLKKNNFSNSQFRNFYGELKRIQLKGISSSNNSFFLLEPKLAYGAARETEARKKDSAKEFFRIISEALHVVISNDENKVVAFQNFCDFAESILAFHKAYDGKVIN